MKLQYMSDLHVEDYPRFVSPPVTARTVALLGDICHGFMPKYKQVLSWFSENYNDVILVPGNHEYHNVLPKEACDDYLRELCDDYGNVHYLNHSHVVLNDIKFIGCTLWYSIPKSLHSLYEAGQGDYRHIVTHNGKLTASDVCRWNEEDVNYIESSLDSGRCVVLTHHPGSEKMTTSYKGDRGKYARAYYNNFEYLMHGKTAPELWLSGHTHLCKREVEGNTLMLSNCKGYPSEESKTGFDPYATVTL